MSASYNYSKMPEVINLLKKVHFGLWQGQYIMAESITEQNTYIMNHEPGNPAQDCDPTIPSKGTPQRSKEFPQGPTSQRFHHLPIPPSLGPSL